jgi:hypothetical protein
MTAPPLSDDNMGCTGFTPHVKYRDKKMTSNLRRVAGLSLLSLLFAAPAFGQSRVPQLVQGSAPKFIQADHAPDVLRERGVSLNLGNLAKAASAGERVIEIAFFDDARFHLLIERTSATHSGGVAHTGVVLGVNDRQPAVIVDNAGEVAATVSVDGRTYVIRGSAERGYVAREMARLGIPDHPSEKFDLSGAKYRQTTITSLAKDGPAPAPTPVAAADNNNIIDVMVIYTQAARNAIAVGTQAQQQAAMNALIDSEVAVTNTVYADSGVVQRLRLVYKGEVNYTEQAGGGGFTTALNQVTTINDGVLDTVPTMRDTYKADFVSLWINNNNSCGLGWLMTNESASFASNGYNVVHWGCSGIANYTFAHELGHNMGLNHDIQPDPGTTTTVTPEQGGGPTVIQYSRGYVDTTNRFRTVMAYADACELLFINCARIGRFSNATQTYDNRGFFAGASPAAPLGLAATADERRALNDTRETTQNFRQPALTTLAGPGIVMFPPGVTTFNVNESAANVVLTVQRITGSTGAVSVAYTTTNGTATSGSDYTTTSGTLNWANGDAADKTITVPILQDAIVEGYESFTVTLSSPTGGVSIGVEAGVTQQATVRIADDEADTFPVSNLLPGGLSTPNVPNVNTPNTQWSVDTTDGFMSNMSLRSAQVYSPQPTGACCNNSAVSDLEYTGVFRAGTVSFHYKLSSYQNTFSSFEFQIDGVSVFSNMNGGEVNWTQINQAITAGTHTLRWRFRNQLNFSCALVTSPAPAQGGNNCADRAWIDNLSMPLALESRDFAKADVNADGRSDLLFQNADGRIAAWTQNALSTTGSANLIGAGAGWTVTHTADLNGDRKADIFFKHTDGRVYVYTMNGLTVTGGKELLGAGLGWSIDRTADMNGDGKADLLLRNADGRSHLWLMDGTAIIGSVQLLGPATGWRVVATGDLNGDGMDDIVFIHADGRGYIYIMNGTTITAGAGFLSPASGWTVTHLGDVNGDGKADMFFRHTDGRAHLFIMNGTAFGAGAELLGAGTGWIVSHVGDMNRDGRADIVFRHTDGRAHVRLMNGTAILSAADVLPAGAGWTVTQLLDFNGDGKLDMVFKNIDGRITVRLMDGLTTLGSANLLGAGTGWSVVPPQPLPVLP